MKIEVVNIEDITPYYNNPRDNSDAIEPVIESIKRFGFIKPIICDKKGIIIAGHTRYLASFRMGSKKVPVIYSDMSEEQAKLFRIADNKLAEKSSYDENKLIEELKSLSVPDDMQAFFFENLDDMLGFSYSDFGSQMQGYNSEDDDSYQEEESYATSPEESSSGLRYEDLYRVRYEDGKKVMTVVCPYCANIETIELS